MIMRVLAIAATSIALPFSAVQAADISIVDPDPTLTFQDNNPADETAEWRIEGWDEYFHIIDDADGDKVVFGANTTSDSINIGYNSVSNGALNIALGVSANAEGSNSVALGRAAHSIGNWSLALGRESGTPGERATAIGYKASASATNSVAIGDEALASGLSSAALGEDASAFGDSSLAVGRLSNAQGLQSTAVGFSADALGIQSTSLGYNTQAIANISTAVGFAAKAETVASLAVGPDAVVEGPRGIAIGEAALVGPSGNLSVALGGFAESQSSRGVALGYSSEVQDTNGVALGYNAVANASSSVAIGPRAQADSFSSIILGAVDGVNGAVGYSNVGNGVTTPVAPLHIFRDDATQQLLLLESDEAGNQDRAMIQLTNNGGIRFQFDNPVQGTAWRFQAATGNEDKFEIAKVGTGEIEFAVDAAGNATLAGVLFENSDRNAKTGIEAVNPMSILDKVAQLPIASWRYKDSPETTHIGPMAQDFRAAFGTGVSDTSLSTIDTSGVALAAIQALAEENRDLRAELSELRTALSEIQQALMNP